MIVFFLIILGLLIYLQRNVSYCDCGHEKPFGRCPKCMDKL